jgi:hypothetical protein
VAQKGDTMSARALQATLGVGEVLVESTGSLESDVTIQVGEDWQNYLAVDELETDEIDRDIPLEEAPSW